MYAAITTLRGSIGGVKQLYRKRPLASSVVAAAAQQLARESSPAYRQYKAA